MKKLEEIEQIIVDNLTSLTNSVTHVGLGDHNCRVGLFALGVKYCKPTCKHETIKIEFCEPYWHFNLGETRDISCNVIKLEDSLSTITKAYYIIYNRQNEVQIYDEAIVNEDNVMFLYHACFKGNYTVKMYIQIGDQILIAHDDLEVV